jgi:hypothetical protein
MQGVCANLEESQMGIPTPTNPYGTLDEVEEKPKKRNPNKREFRDEDGDGRPDETQSGENLGLNETGKGRQRSRK